LTVEANSVVHPYGAPSDVVQGGAVLPSAGIVGGFGIANDATSDVSVYGSPTILSGLQGGVATGAAILGSVTLGLPAAPTLDTTGAGAAAFTFIPLLTPELLDVPFYAQAAVLDGGVLRTSNGDARVFRLL
jgi:hypothetical protein